MGLFCKSPTASLIFFIFEALICFPLTAEQIHGVNIFRPVEAQFSTLLKAEFPDAIGLENLGDILQLAVIVQNQSEKPIRAYSIHWFIEPASGLPINQGRFVVKGHADKHILTGQFPALKKGEYQLVLPFAVWSSLKKAPNSANSGVSLNLNTFEQNTLVQRARNATLINSRLDAVLGDDQIVAGKDTLNLLDYYTAQRNAQHDEGLSVQHLLAANVNEADLLAKMQYHVSLGAPSGRVQVASTYLQARSEEASLLISIYQKYGRTALQNVVARLLRIRRSAIKRG